MDTDVSKFGIVNSTTFFLIFSDAVTVRDFFYDMALKGENSGKHMKYFNISTIFPQNLRRTNQHGTEKCWHCHCLS